MTAMRLIANQLDCARGGRTIVENVSFVVEAGEALVVTGENGAGKTTLLRSLAGFLPLAGGTLTIEGGEQDASLAEHCHYVGHKDGIKAGLSVIENLEFWARYLGGGTQRSLLLEALDRLGVADLADFPAAYLSAGQKRRAGLARLLAAGRAIWLMDEPTASLDAASQDLVRDLVADHLSEGGLAIAATHIPLGVDGAKQLRLAQPDFVS